MAESSRAQAWDLLCEWTQSDSLRRHMLAVEAAMRAYAPRFDGDVELWGLTGLLHDLDYERYPDLETGHPRYAMRELEARGYPPELVRAVASHATYLGVSRDTPMEKTLFAVDELAGFVLACAYVRPSGLDGMTPKSVKKKMKTPAFAAAVSREDMTEGAAELGVDFDEHLRIVIAALAEHSDELLPAHRLAVRCPRPRPRRPGRKGPETGTYLRPHGDRPSAGPALGYVEVVMALKIVVLEGDETGQELLEESLRVLDGDLLGLELELPRFDLSLESRRETDNGVVEEAAAAMREAGLGLKAATITPEGAGDVGSPNRILRERVDGKVIVRTGRRLPGVAPIAGVHHPISVVRMAVEDAYGAAESREGEPGSARRGRAADRADHPFHLPRGRRVRVSHGGQDGRQGLRRPQVDGLARV